jgi:probable HAF family extracellular repeat protein
MRRSFASLCLLPVLTLSCLLLATSSAVAQTYKVIDLGLFSGDDRSAANSINDAGDVVGVSVKSGPGDPVVSPDLNHGFLYKRGQLSDLGLSGNVSFANGVAGGKEREGWERDDDKDEGRNKLRITGAVNNGPFLAGFLYQDHLLRYLGNLPGGTSSIGMAVNRRGEVAGLAFDENNEARGFLYKHGTLINLGSFSDAGVSIAYALNDHGDVTGYSDLPSFITDVFLYEDGQLKDIGGLPGHFFSIGYGINDARQIVGWSGGPDGAFGFRWEKGKFKNLGILRGGSTSRAQGINNHGEIVGSADWNATNALDTHAVLYRFDKWEDLNRMIPADSGWELNVAQAINDEGEIAGTGTINGASHAFLLKPICPRKR